MIIRSLQPFVNIPDAGLFCKSAIAPEEQDVYGRRVSGFLTWRSSGAHVLQGNKAINMLLLRSKENPGFNQRVYVHQP